MKNCVTDLIKTAYADKVSEFDWYHVHQKRIPADSTDIWSQAIQHQLWRMESKAFWYIDVMSWTGFLVKGISNLTGEKSENLVIVSSIWLEIETHGGTLVTGIGKEQRDIFPFFPWNHWSEN